jgi:ABC-type branched-subunit amino acid transport system substrate-binding protein
LAACGSSPARAGSNATSTSTSASASTSGAVPAVASAPGVTRTSVTVGQIADISEPVPGLFKSAQVGVQAYFDYINSQGGVNGRKLILDSHDSAFQPADVVTASQEIAKNELAFVGNYTLLDSSAKTIIDADHVPNIGTPIGEALANDPNTYNPSPSGDYVADLGPFQYFKEKDPQATQHVGILYAAATPSTIQAYQVLRQVLAHLGYKVIYARGFSAFETTFTADVVKMKSAGVQFFWADVPSNYSAVLAREMALQDFKPINYQTAGYGSDLTQLGGSAVNGTYLPLFTALFLGQDARTTPIVGTFDKWMAKVDSKDSIASWGAAGWASADLFVQALRNAGKNPTRASLVAALNKITSFNAHGLIPTSDPAKNIPSPCWLLAQVKGSSIVRVPPSPKSGFICKPGGQFDLPGYAPLKRG